MLAQEVTRTYGKRVRFQVEDLGASEIGNRFGINKYPAVFVDEALVARPEDFYAWGGPETGKYMPWKELASRRRFQADLKRLLDLKLAGGAIESLQPAPAATPKPMPDLAMTDLSGRKFRLADLRGRKVVLEVWASWCPICIESMRWMKTSGMKDVEVVAVAVASDRKDIEKIVAELKPDARVVMATPELEKALDPPSIPTTFVLDENGRVVHTFYGASPGFRQELTRLVDIAPRV